MKAKIESISLHGAHEEDIEVTVKIFEDEPDPIAGDMTEKFLDRVKFFATGMTEAEIEEKASEILQERVAPQPMPPEKAVISAKVKALENNVYDSEKLKK